MLVQIYEVTSPEEASALSKLGVDHIGVLVGEGEFPREQSVQTAKRIFSAISPSSKGCALSLSANLDAIERVVATLAPSILHLGASTDLLFPEHVLQLKRKYKRLFVLRSVPVVRKKFFHGFSHRMRRR
jgi:phosphoribosylanthranilate isomerase